VPFHRYAIGGFDGGSLVASVEVFDPRRGTWMTDTPMNHARGYSAAAVLGNAVYVIGGWEGNGNIADKVSTLPVWASFPLLASLINAFSLTWGFPPVFSIDLGSSGLCLCDHVYDVFSIFLLQLFNLFAKGLKPLKNLFGSFTWVMQD